MSPLKTMARRQECPRSALIPLDTAKTISLTVLVGACIHRNRAGRLFMNPGFLDWKSGFVQTLVLGALT